MKKAAMLVLSVASMQAVAADSIETRFGDLGFNDQGVITLSESVTPIKEEFQFGHFIKKYSRDNKEVVLMSSHYGTSCPALFRFVIIEEDRISSTSDFGTCSDYYKMNSSVAGQISISVQDMEGKDAEFVFSTKDYSMTENASPVSGFMFSTYFIK